jgi:Cu-processing system permease protein
MTGALIIAGFALRESLRRRVFVVVAILTVAFLALYGLGTWQIAKEADELGNTNGVQGEIVAGATLLGLSMFATLFLGAILAVFLTLGAVRGDAERGLLQPLLVRPVTRRTLLLGRYAAAATVCAAYVIAVFLATAVITRITGGWWPDRIIVPALGLAFAVAIIAAVSLAGSVFLSANANGIAVFMAFGAGLTAGLMGQIGAGLNAETLETIGRVASWLLPFEALYQAGLDALTSDVRGVTGVIVRLGPFGGAQEGGPLLWVWTFAYLGFVGLAAQLAFARRDL